MVFKSFVIPPGIEESAKHAKVYDEELSPVLQQLLVAKQRNKKKGVQDEEVVFIEEEEEEEEEEKSESTRGKNILPKRSRNKVQMQNTKVTEEKESTEKKCLAKKE